jgi:tRNA A-37 threonylcarbamoyl transferase component Bud32
MARDMLYTYAHPEFYEELTRYEGGPEYHERLEKNLPQSWRLERRSLWLHAREPDAQLPSQGFKIHVSSTPEHAADVLDSISRECFAWGIGFKLAADSRLLRLLNSKPYDRGGSGKFMTLYPADESTFREFIDELHQKTKDTNFVGPYILSDRRYRDSRILFYRYGGIVGLQKLMIDGSKQSVLVAADGTTSRDIRYPYFKLPEGIVDPFGGTTEVMGEDEPVLGGRFRIETMIAVSNRGGVYEGEDLEDGSTVIIKEARPFINRVKSENRVIDSMVLMDREYAILRRLEPVGMTPKPVAIFEEWEHKFLVQEKLEGLILRRFVVQDGNLVLPYIHRDGVLQAFLPVFRTIGLLLIHAVRKIHDAGVIIGDLSQSNVMVDETGTRLWLIDLESAVLDDDDEDWVSFSRDWYTPGFARPGRRNSQGLTFQDDHYAVGMILLSLFLGGLEFFRLKPEGREQFVHELVALGLPQAAREAIFALMRGDLDHAESALESLALRSDGEAA